MKRSGRSAVLWDELRSGLLPVPLAMVVIALLLKQGVGWIDAVVSDEDMLRRWWLHSGSGDDARHLLSTLVTAIITMASVVFSITVVTLSLAANQFSSRLVRTYLRDPQTQIALGLLTMTIVYTLLALRSVQAKMTPQQVPHVSVTVALVLSLASVVALLVFLHRTARSIVADEVIRRVAIELEETIAELPALDKERTRPRAEEVVPAEFDSDGVVVPSRNEGYIQSIDHGSLVDLAREHQVLIRLDCRAGDFMCRQGWIATVHPRRNVTPALSGGLQEAFLLGDERTPTQDIEFCIRHLVDVALRALSPGINDANTALVVIDRLRGALSRLFGKALPSGIHHDGEGTVRVVAHYNGYAGVLDAALHQVRQSAAPHPSVVITLLAAIGRLAEHVRLEEQRDALQRHARLISAAGLRECEEACDRHDIEAAFVAAESKLAQALAPPGQRPSVTEVPPA